MYYYLTKLTNQNVNFSQVKKGDYRIKTVLVFTCFLFTLFFSYPSNLLSAGNNKNYVISREYHTVKKGETLFGISRKYNVTVRRLQNLNAISGSNIFAGQKLKINEFYRLKDNYKGTSKASKRFVTAVAYENYRYIFQVNQNRQKLGLKSYRQTHHLTYEGRVIASVEDNVKSVHTVHADGIRYYGHEKAHRNFIYKYAGNDMQVARALAFASSNEGSFDALNFYDGSGSVGFIQFNAKYGALGYLLAWMKEHQSYLFRKYFQEYGIDVEYFRHNSYTYSSISIIVADPIRSTGKFKLRDTEAITYLRKNKKLSGIFVRAFRNEQLKACQIQAAVQMFVKPIQNSYMAFGKDSFRTGVILSSDAGTAALVDLSVKLGADGAKKVIEQAIRLHLLKAGKRYSAAPYVSDKEIINAIMLNCNNAVVKKRMQKLLNSKLRFV